MHAMCAGMCRLLNVILAFILVLQKNLWFAMLKPEAPFLDDRIALVIRGVPLAIKKTKTAQ